ncbi:MAG TPA: DUF5694 domain-containing protein [Thermoanaerobaculia bacterium]|nr:DUF5694 domain-containing protein [Thermoanaerobaculia bacterium]
MKMKPLVCLIALTLVGAARAVSRPSPPGNAPRAEVLVLGVYHMANPGHDIFNTQADDVLTTKRQAEIGQVIAALKKFNPTKIAVEADVYGDRISKRYSDYQAGKYELTRNEIDQLGLRLAKELGHKTVYGTDADWDFPWQRVVNYAKASGRSKELDGIMGEIGEMVKAQSAYLASHTILETLLYMNADAKVAQDVGFYFREAHLAEPGDWAGPDLVADWFRRNMRIYGNIARIADSPNDRILVIFGSGHLGWLRHAVESDPTMRLRRLAEFAR